MSGGRRWRRDTTGTATAPRTAAARTPGSIGGSISIVPSYPHTFSAMVGVLHRSLLPERNGDRPSNCRGSHSW